MLSWDISDIASAYNEIMWTVGEDGEVTAAHFLLGIWSEKESAGHKIMAALGFDDAKAKEVAKFVSFNLKFLTAIWSIIKPLLIKLISGLRNNLLKLSIQLVLCVLFVYLCEYPYYL